MKNSLACMPKDFAYHPWQAIMVSLAGMGIRPRRCPRNQDPPSWTAEERACFREILNSFPLVKTRTVKSSVIYNDYRKPIMVELYGIPEGYTDTSPDAGISIAALFTAECCGRVKSLRVVNAAKFSSVPNFSVRKPPPSLEDIPPYRRTFPSDWRHDPSASNQSSYQNENATLWEDWSPQAARVPPIEVKWLDDHGYRTSQGEYLVNIEGSQTQSPYEFYARPIKRERIRTIQSDDEFVDEVQLQSECDAMLSAHDELRKKATILDAFYSLEENRSPIDRTQCSTWLKDNVRVFAICACCEERAAYTGEWQRVEILSCNEFACVLFVDSGGTELVLPQSLYKIHPSHCTYPAMCMQLCMHGVKPNTDSSGLEWGEGSKALWRELLREDLPMVIGVLKRLNSAEDNRVLLASEPAWRRPGVMFIQFMKVYGDNSSTLEKFCNPARGQDSGIVCEDIPREWVYDSFS
ncbi:hypothetical protein KIN20_004587 [Parelaphostrongylus tenuis]|uniref:Tudor domain-containing protein n=1 Tax=Parelaphostrongylus tenuis TaxID=148309 RepID=A0AAD5M1Y5_PARTN|nr:hypothetical protein KIN20_004587 [Parelaphostrongylus tenuis]